MKTLILALTFILITLGQVRAEIKCVKSLSGMRCEGDNGYTAKISDDGEIYKDNQDRKFRKVSDIIPKSYSDKDKTIYKDREGNKIKCKPDLYDRLICN